MSRQSQCSRVLQAPSRTVGYRPFKSRTPHSPSSRNLQSSCPQFHLLAHTRQAASVNDSGRWVAAVYISHQNIFASSLTVSESLAGERRSVTPASLSAVGIHGIPRRGVDSYERIVPGRGEGEVGLRLRREATSRHQLQHYGVVRRRRELLAHMAGTCTKGIEVSANWQARIKPVVQWDPENYQPIPYVPLSPTRIGRKAAQCWDTELLLPRILGTHFNFPLFFLYSCNEHISFFLQPYAYQYAAHSYVTSNKKRVSHRCYRRQFSVRQRNMVLTVNDVYHTRGNFLNIIHSRLLHTRGQRTAFLRTQFKALVINRGEHTPVVTRTRKIPFIEHISGNAILPQGQQTHGSRLMCLGRTAGRDSRNWAARRAVELRSTGPIPLDRTKECVNSIVITRGVRGDLQRYATAAISLSRRTVLIFPPLGVTRDVGNLLDWASETVLAAADLRVESIELGRLCDLKRQECEDSEDTSSDDSDYRELTRKGVMKLEIAQKNNLSTRFNEENQEAVLEYATSSARADGFNKVVVNKFFDALEKIVDQEQITASRNFNMNETSHAVVQRLEKCVAHRGKYQVGGITACERGKNVTSVYTMTAAGLFIPPMLIYTRKRMKDSLVFGVPSGTIFSCQDKSWMTADVFTEWMSHFIRDLKPSVTENVLLILDGQSSHTQSLDAIDLARKNGVIMLSLPSHCTHRTQPLDVAFFKPLHIFVDCAITTRLRTKTGLWPVNRRVFTDADFTAASVTDRPFQESGAKEQEQPIELSIVSLDVMMPEQMEHVDDARQSNVYDLPEINVPTTFRDISKRSTNVLGSAATRYISAEEINPLPSCSFSPQQKKRRRREISGIVLTSMRHNESLSKNPRSSSKTSASMKKKHLFTNVQSNSQKKKKKMCMFPITRIQRASTVVTLMKQTGSSWMRSLDFNFYVHTCKFPSAIGRVSESGDILCSAGPIRIKLSLTLNGHDWMADP
ncbi:hypothetical protein PR048_015018 [Dryococelus australis]|uniref:DDE-1 domain-containing protein n=1 Tax=Dryococelus australis TaxID=614101 RepID=A0ABQ9HGP0_9NEOP|nr:hypothetical protein PR048_015018 [Dryococelus australis]